MCLVAEVHNTYGERTAYLLHPDEHGTAEAEKTFYVSPFNDVSGSYRMRFVLRDDAVAVSIRLDREGHAPFHASFTGTPRPATPGRLVRALMTMPLMPQRARTLITVHGVWLWLRRLPSSRDRCTPQPRRSRDDRTRRPLRRAPPAARGHLREGAHRPMVDGLRDRQAPVTVRFPDGSVRGAGGPGSQVLEIVRPKAFYDRISHNPKIGSARPTWPEIGGPPRAAIWAPRSRRSPSG